MNTTSPLHVSCLCGRVRITAVRPSKKAGHCHCDNCRRAQGAGVWTWVTFPAEAVHVERGEEDLRSYMSGTEAIRRFCGVCGSSLTFSSPRWPGLVDLSAANFEEPLDREPSHHTYADRSPEWCPILDDLPRRGGAGGMQPI